MKINDLVREVYETAKSKGWYDKPRSALEIHALIHSEISEATEAVRKDQPNYTSSLQTDGYTLKPDGEAVELVDAVIRIMDYFGHKGWDMEQVLTQKMDYNKQRSYRHGNKKY